MMKTKYTSFKDLKQFDKILLSGLADYVGLVYLTHTQLSPGISNTVSYTMIRFYDIEKDSIWSGMFSTSDTFRVATL